MNQRISRFISNIRSLLTVTLTNYSEEGSGLGIFLRAVFRKRKFSFRQLLGVNLAGFAFFSAVIVPQSQNVLSSLEVALKSERQVIAVEPSASPYQWPLRAFGISQYFSSFHPGMDLTDACGTPIYPIGKGTVTWVKYEAFGYGSHMLVANENNVQSLYAHMAEIEVHEGQQVNKDTKLGEIGVTGHSTGCHLHAELYVNSAPTNPIDVLPPLKDVSPTTGLQQTP